MFVKERTLTVESKTIIRPMTRDELAAKRAAGQEAMRRWFARREAMQVANA